VYMKEPIIIEKKQYKKKYEILGLILITIILSCTGYFAYEVKVLLKKNSQEKFFNDALYLTKSIENEVTTYKSILQSYVGLYAASQEINRQEWTTFINKQHLFDNYPGIESFEFVQRVMDEPSNKYIIKTDEFVSHVQKEYTDFSIFPQGEREYYYVITYIEPFQENKKLLGFDIATDQKQKIIFEEARDTGKLSMSTPLEKNGKNIVSGVLPIYFNGVQTNTLEQRRDNIQGFIVATFDVDTFFATIANQFVDTLDMHFILQDSDEDKPFFEVQESQYHKDNPNFYFFNTINVGGRIWQLRAHPNQHFFDQHENDIIYSIIIIIFGLLLSVITGLIIFFLGKSRKQAIVLAEKMLVGFQEEKKHAEQEKKKVENALKELKKEKQISDKKTKELEKMNEQMIGREVKMVELKKQIKNLEKGK